MESASLTAPSQLPSPRSAKWPEELVSWSALASWRAHPPAPAQSWRILSPSGLLACLDVVSWLQALSQNPYPRLPSLLLPVPGPKTGPMFLSQEGGAGGEQRWGTRDRMETCGSFARSPPRFLASS